MSVQQEGTASADKFNPLIKTLLNRYTKNGKSRQQIHDELYDPDDTENRLCNEFMAVYDKLYPSTTSDSQPTQSSGLVEEPVRETQINWRFGQFETYNKWKTVLDQTQKYWGSVIAPTGWGKSFMTMVMIGAFLLRQPAKNVLYITKRKDVLGSQFLDSKFKYKLQSLAANGLFPPTSIEKVRNMFNQTEFAKFRKYCLTTPTNQALGGSIFIFNVDKLTTDGKILNWILKHFAIGALIFDEMHWTGAEGICDSIKMIKGQVPYGIGFSATPVRIMADNQRRTYELFGDGLELEVLHEVTYTEGWHHNIILPIKHFYFPIAMNDLIPTSTIDINSGILDTRPSVDSPSRNPGQTITYKISDSGHHKLLTSVSTEIWRDKLKYRKAIMYFESRARLVEFYTKIRGGMFSDIPMICACLASGIYMSFSFQTSTDSVMLSKLAMLGISAEKITNGINDFKTKTQNSLLMVVGQAVEGFDDYRVEMVIEMDYAASRNPLTTLQKIGRAQRIEDNPNESNPKQFGYYICPVSQKSNKRELCKYIAGLTKDYLASVGTDILDEEPNATPESQSLGQGLITDNPQLVPNRIKQIISQNLYLSDGYEISADDILSEIRVLGYKNIRTARGIAKFCREYNIKSSAEYHTFLSSNPGKFELRPNPTDYAGFGWRLVIDPNGVNYYTTREECVARISVVDSEFQTRYSQDPKSIVNKELHSMRRFQKIKYYNKLDPRIPCMSPDDFYGVVKAK